VKKYVKSNIFFKTLTELSRRDMFDIRVVYAVFSFYDFSAIARPVKF